MQTDQALPDADDLGDRFACAGWASRTGGPTAAEHRWVRFRRDGSLVLRQSIFTFVSKMEDLRSSNCMFWYAFLYTLGEVG